MQKNFSGLSGLGQYYDTRGILTPSEISEGGRRLYSEDDFNRIKTICFLRDVGISINSIGELLSKTNLSSVISALLEQQEQLLRKEISERQAKIVQFSLQKALNVYSICSLYTSVQTTSNPPFPTWGTT